MSVPNELSPGPGSPFRTSVPLATRTPARASLSPSNVPPSLSAKMATPSPVSIRPSPSPAPSNYTRPKSTVDTGSVFSSSSDDMMAYRENLLNYSLQIGLQVIPAIAMGMIVDKVLKKLQHRFQLGPVVMILIQLIVIVVLLFIIEKYIATNYADAWQLTTPGFFFPVFFFGVQFNLFENLKKLKVMVFDDKEKQ